jgi:predicted RNA methylase
MHDIKPVSNKNKFSCDKINEYKINEYKLNEESKYSITGKLQGEQFIKIAKDFTGQNLKTLTITDGTAGAGGDTINFSNNFKHVIGIEIKKDTFKLLIKNCEHFKCSNVTLINDDYSIIYDKLRQDIIYLDPPWGGPEYKFKKEVELLVGKYTLKQMIDKIVKDKLCKYIFIKIPYNCNIKSIKINNFSIIYNTYGIPSYIVACIRI